MPKVDHRRPLRDAIDVVADGHPELLALLTALAHDGAPGETPDAPTRAVIYLDDFDCRGELAWRLFAQVCRGDLTLFMRVLLGVSFGALTPSGLRVGIDEDLIDPEAIARFSARVEAALRRQARMVTRNLPTPPPFPVLEGELLGVLQHFFGNPLAAAGFDEEIPECL